MQCRQKDRQKYIRIGGYIDRQKYIQIDGYIDRYMDIERKKKI